MTIHQSDQERGLPDCASAATLGTTYYSVVNVEQSVIMLLDSEAIVMVDF